jgi:hypothetical protein
MAHLLEAANVTLPSEMVYYGPGFAYQWLSASRGEGNLAQAQAFEQALGQILEFFGNQLTQDRALSVIDLGIGDFEKGESVIKGLLALLSESSLQYVAYDISFEMVCTPLESLGDVKQLTTYAGSDIK